MPFGIKRHGKAGKNFLPALPWYFYSFTNKIFMFRSSLILTKAANTFAY